MKHLAGVRRRRISLQPLNGSAKELAESHVVLARRLAWRQFRNCSHTVPLEDLRGEALYGLVYAAGMFDPTRGVPFGAYATLAITHRLIQAVNFWRRGGRLDHVRFTDVCANTGGDFDTPCPRTRESSEQTSESELIDRVRRALPARWFQALNLYYAHGHTLEEVGHRLGVTRERVRQLLSKAVERARENSSVFVCELEASAVSA
ncbi:MAG: sigma-70 family RNA polymerase sigma factor [Planctomycetes bacterium]|nr:sigma-70 family RNA polymerase sigma factor [Planctomycetota bacterium]